MLPLRACAAIFESRYFFKVVGPEAEVLDPVLSYLLPEE